MWFVLITYFIIAPIIVLLHEMGHALGIILSTKGIAKLYLGPENEESDYGIEKVPLVR